VLEGGGERRHVWRDRADPRLLKRRVDSGNGRHRLRRMSYPDFLLDKRVVGRNIEKGLVDKKEYQKALKSLADAEGNAEPIVTEEPAAEGEAESSDQSSDGE